MRKPVGVLAGGAIAVVETYRRLVSPALPARCRFYPSCSAYSQQAFRRFGFWRGCILTVARVARCQPLFRGGVDEVPTTFLWRSFE